MTMPSFSKNDVILVAYPFSDRSGVKVRPAGETHFTASEFVRDIVIGMSDGLTVPFALAAGLSGAVESSVIIITAGLAEVAAGAIAMWLGGYMAGRTDIEHFATERVREERIMEDLCRRMRISQTDLTVQKTSVPTGRQRSRTARRARDHRPSPGTRSLLRRQSKQSPPRSTRYSSICMIPT
jgi:hypothetical protein